MSETALIHTPGAEIVSSADFMPILTVEQAVQRKQMLNQYISGIMTEETDYGYMPGDSRKEKKRVLLKPGAEKMCSVFGLAAMYVKETIIEDWTGKDHAGEPLFYYEYRCQLWRGQKCMGEAIGSANSWEVKYRYRWVSEQAMIQIIDPDLVMSDDEFEAQLRKYTKRGSKQAKFEPDFAIAKREAEGKYGHPAEYWNQFTADAGAKRVHGKKLGTKTFDGWEVTVDATQFRIPNPDVADIVNTLQKMAQKRALVAAVLVVTNCSDAFTQDVEDFVEPGHEHETAKTEPLPAQLPGELEELFKADAPAGAIKSAFEMCKRELMEAFPANGEEEYKRLLDVNGIKATGGNQKATVRRAVTQMWTLAQSAKKLQRQRQEPQGASQPDEWGDWPDR